VDWLQEPAIELFHTPVTWLELIADLAGALSVWWATREVVLTWPAGLLNSALFLVLFIDVDLFASAGLQVAFIVLGLYGWWSWARGVPDPEGSTSSGELPVRRTVPREWVVLGVCTVVGVAFIAWLLTSHTASPAPWWDAIVLVLSLVATYGQAQKLVESWAIWIVVDVVSVPLYASRELLPTALLYAGFGVLCVLGWRDWSRSLSEHESDELLAGEPA
jgi:nicotinamide mononucleotide transporter